MSKFFSLAKLGEINEPAIILDHFGKIVAWHLPDVISCGRVVGLILFWVAIHEIYTLYSFQEDVNLASICISDLLKASQPRVGSSRVRKKKNEAEAPLKHKARPKTINWRADPRLFKAPENPRFVPGSVEFSPGWFALAHEVRFVRLPVL
jgi:hypothetical protein